MTKVVDWVPELIERLTLMWAGGLSAGTIASELKTTRSTVIGKVRRLNLPKRDTTVSLRTSRPPRKNGFVFGKAPPPRQVLPPSVPAETGGDVARIEWPEPGRCKWPVGEVGSPGFGFCGLEAGWRYCAEHEDRSRARGYR